MGLQIKELQKKDYKKAVRFAITGMHFNWYVDSPFLLHLYGWYFWCLELSRATQVIAAYEGDELAGVLLAEVKGEQKKYRSFWRMLYVKIFDVLQKVYSKDGAGLYEKTTADMLEEFLEHNSPDGEIIFLAANPGVKSKGTGTLLLAEFERREPGKTIYLNTDDACTYQFYEHRGFGRVCEKDIVLDMGKKKVPLKCFIYSKTIGVNNIGAGILSDR